MASEVDSINTGVLFLVTEDWYFRSHRLPIARSAREAGFNVSIVTREDQDGESIRLEGFRLINLDMGRGRINPVTELRTLFKLWRIFRQEQPQIIHNVALKPVILGTLAARMAGIRIVVNALAGLGYAFTSRGQRAFLLRALAENAFRILFRSPSVYVIVQNPADRQFVESLGVPSKRVALIPGSGVDLSAYQVFPEPEPPVVVAMVSRMLWDKGVGDLVEAARIIMRSGHDARIRLVGPTDPANPSSIPESTLKEWVNEGIIDWSGPTRNAAAIWKGSHIGVLPSYREGLPKSLLEAAASGRPLIATDTPGCRDIVIHDETGLLVPPQNPEALAAAIIRLAENKGLRVRLGRAARARVEAKFSVERIVGQTLSLYRSLLFRA